MFGGGRAAGGGLGTCRCPQAGGQDPLHLRAPSISVRISSHPPVPRTTPVPRLGVGTRDHCRVTAVPPPSPSCPLCSRPARIKHGEVEEPKGKSGGERRPEGVASASGSPSGSNLPIPKPSPIFGPPEPRCQPGDPRRDLVTVPCAPQLGGKASLSPRPRAPAGLNDTAAGPAAHLRACRGMCLLN